MLKIENATKGLFPSIKEKKSQCMHFILPCSLYKREDPITRKKVFGIPLYYKYTDFHFVFCIQSYCFLLFRFTHILVMGHE